MRILKKIINWINSFFNKSNDQVNTYSRKQNIALRRYIGKYSGARRYTKAPAIQ
jgi:hypothetical protein